MRLKRFLKTNFMTAGLYQILKKEKQKQQKSKHDAWKKVKYTFENRSNGKKKLCILLAGYKPFLYEITFERIRRFLDEDIDMCVVTSGLYSKKIDDYCKECGWSYLRTEINNVSLVQNLAIRLHPQADYIYKMDEDIFVTEGTFSKMFETFLDCENNGEYNPLLVAPILPINGYCHLRLLEKLKLVDEYASRFEKPKFAAGPDRMIESNPEVAKFFWGASEHIPHIDVLNARFQNEELRYSACPIRFSIGFVLFKRSIWNLMDGFEVNLESTAMGMDEIQLCSVAMSSSYAIIVSENCVCGHLSFGPQNDEMKKYFLEHPEAFQIKEM